MSIHTHVIPANCEAINRPGSKILSIHTHVIPANCEAINRPGSKILSIHTHVIPAIAKQLIGRDPKFTSKGAHNDSRSPSITWPCTCART